jgi:23S rRNA (pseudouridine1915-N3)-methyltransferase
MVRWKVLAIGRPKLAFAKLGVEEYEVRLRPWMKLQVECLRAGSREEESEALLERSKGWWRVVLDERGDQVRSRELASRISTWEQRPEIKGVAWLIGGADGHCPELREQADWCWALSSLTLQHEMALLLVMEQLYRACSIKAGTPYHRD